MVDPRLFQALSDATRLEILSVLAAGPINVSKIVAHVGCAQPAVSRHLRVLREASLINDKRKGKEVEYSINGEVLLAAVAHLTGLAGEAASSASARATSPDAETKPMGTRTARVAPALEARSERGRKGSGRKGSGRKAGRPAVKSDKKAKAPAGFNSGEASYTVERRPSGMDDFLL